MDDQKDRTNRVRRIYPADSAEQAGYEPQDDFDEEDYEPIQERRPGAVPVRSSRAGGPAPAPRSEIVQYLIGGVVSAAVLLLLIVVYLMATANKSTPTAADNGTNNQSLEGDVPTIAVPVSSGTLEPGAVATSGLVVPAGVPTGSPAPQSYMQHYFADGSTLYTLGR